MKYYLIVLLFCAVVAIICYGQYCPTRVVAAITGPCQISGYRNARPLCPVLYTDGTTGWQIQPRIGWGRPVCGAEFPW